MTDSRYDDILHLPHPDPVRHPRMTIAERAAQFSPFAALTGYGDVISETGRLTEARPELDDEQKAALDASLHDIRERLSEHPAVRLRYFRPDGKKAGGALLSLEERVRNIDDAHHTLVLEGGQSVPLADIVGLEAVEDYSEQ